MHLTRKTPCKLALALLSLLPVLLFTGCSLFAGGPPASVKAPAAQQVYTSPLIFLNGNTDLTIDPALAYDQNSLSVISMIDTGLVSLDDHMQPQPQLARSWEQSPDGRTWTFHLRPNLTFSDGTPLTASDVAYSINRALLPATRSSIAPIYLGIIQDADKLLGGSIPTLLNDSLQVVDQHTLKILTRQAAPYFLDMLAKNCSFVVEQKLLTLSQGDFASYVKQGGGAGPFVVSQYLPGQRITLVPNRRYYGPRPQLRSVILPFYTQQVAAYNDYAAGKVDTAGVPLAALPAISKRSDFHQVPQFWINYYTMNYRVPPFDNLHIRQAFALAVNKSALAGAVWKNTVIPTNHILPQGMPGYNPDLRGPDGTRSLAGNPREAQALFRQGLQEEHWSSLSQFPTLKLTYATGVSSFDQEVQMLVSMWQKVLGVTVTPDPVDSNTLLDEVSAATGNTQGIQMWGLSWVAEYPDPQDWLSRQFGNGSVFNNMNYGQNTSSDVARQQLTQQQLLKADSDLESGARLQMYRQAEQQLVNDVAWLPLEQVTGVFLRKPYVVGMADNGLGLLPPDEWAGVFLLQH